MEPTVDKLPFEAEVFASDDRREWIVQAIERPEGCILEATFSGPGAEARAIEYADAKFEKATRHNPPPVVGPLRVISGGLE